MSAWGSASARFRELRRDKLLEPGTPKRREARRRLVPDNLVKELEQLLIDCSDQLNILQTVVSRDPTPRSVSACIRIMVKPHGGLVSVSSTCRHAYTSDLSTWSSSRSLQGSCDPGRSHLVEGFTLRCLQRFSLPDVATRRCRWRDNRYTRGPSIPVLSY